MRAQTLVKMANQIAVSVPDQSKAVQQTAAHLAAFWTPAMIDVLNAHVADAPESVSSTVQGALASLRPV